MASYSLQFKPSVRKDLRSLSSVAVSRVMKRIENLKDDPLPRQAVKLSGTQRLYRIRIGVYRVVYEVDTQAKRVTVHYVRHRREAYREA